MASDGTLPAVLGLNRTQDASLCLLRGHEVVLSLQKERLTRTKHHWGAVGDLRLYRSRLPQLAEPVDLVVESFSSDPEIGRLAEYRREIEECLTFRGQPRVVRVSHHLAHTYTAFHPSPLDEAAVMVIDFMGSPVRDVTEPWPGASSADPDQVEVGSFYSCGYSCGRERISCLGKQLWNRDRSRPVGLGCFYYFLTQALFPGEGNEGKVMGLAAYAGAGEIPLPRLRVEGCEVHIPGEWLEILGDRERFGHFSLGSGTFQECARLAAAGQHAFEEALLEVSRWLYRETGCPALCFAGGTALNCVANSALRQRSPFSEVFVPPAPHDGGTALGAALYGLAEVLGVEPSFRWRTDFLGAEPDLSGVENEFTAAEDLEWDRPSDLVGEVVGRLVRGQAVALYQGRAELGPRALGHRSILADPRVPGMQDWINRRVKGREWFRPLAPMVLLEETSRYFEVDRPSPWMLFSAVVRPERRGEIPAVVHADGSARIQTVAPEDDGLVYRLLSAFRRETGCGVLLNTSFNGMGEPLVETPAEALHCLRTTGLHALAMPPYLVWKKASGGST